jgi:hypothetical protein
MFLDDPHLDGEFVGPGRGQRMNFKKYFYGLLLICERGTTGLGDINS